MAEVTLDLIAGQVARVLDEPRLAREERADSKLYLSISSKCRPIVTPGAGAKAPSVIESPSSGLESRQRSQAKPVMGAAYAALRRAS